MTNNIIKLNMVGQTLVSNKYFSQLLWIIILINYISYVYNETVHLCVLLNYNHL